MSGMESHSLQVHIQDVCCVSGCSVCVSVHTSTAASGKEQTLGVDIRKTGGSVRRAGMSQATLAEGDDSL